MSGTNANIPLTLSKGAPPISIPVSSQPTGAAGLPKADQRRISSSSVSATPKMSSPRNNQTLRKQNKGSRRPKLSEEAADAASIRTNSRKGQTNITHLMNFTLPPRPQNYSYNSHAGRGHYTVRRSQWGGYHPADKARYIHANYRFVVSPQGNYDHLTTVDDHIDWKDVLQVLVSSKSQSTNCPICLSDPISPRMAKCGHIFCLPCLIRYMHSTDDAGAGVPERKTRWKKCPICEDSIYISEARPVRWFIGQEGEAPREETDIVLRLMKRDYDSTLALPREGIDSSTLKHDIPWYFIPDVMDYAQIMKGTEDYMQGQYDQEIADVELQEKEDELMFGEDHQWTQKAIMSIKDAKEKVRGIGNHPAGPSSKAQDKRAMGNGSCVQEDLGQLPSFPKRDLTPRFTRSESISSVETQQTGNTSISLTQSTQIHLNMKQVNQNQAYSGSDSSTFFFYQALLHYYLAPLDIRILKAAFDDYSLFPSAVLARVEHVSTGHIVDDDLRKRAKYLGHLPQGCEVGFLECDWTDIVPAGVLKRFAPDLERRRKKNKDKETREEKERLRAEKEEDDKRWASIRRRRSSVSHEVASASSIGIPGSSVCAGSLDFATSASPPWTQSRAGFSSLASPSTSPSGARTVWGTSVIAPLESPTLSAMRPVTGSENDGWLQGWEQDLLRDDEVLAQIQAVSLGDGNVTAGQPAGKKKKQKKITLMSTNGGRRGA